MGGIFNNPTLMEEREKDPGSDREKDPGSDRTRCVCSSILIPLKPLGTSRERRPRPPLPPPPVG